jgi:hypothetical protein
MLRTTITTGLKNTVWEKRRANSRSNALDGKIAYRGVMVARQMLSSPRLSLRRWHSANFESLHTGLGEQLVERGNLGARSAARAIGEHDPLLGARERNEEASRRFHLIG